MNNINLLKVYNFNNKIRLGKNYDGGYIIGDLNNYDCYISAGVANEESFSRDFINKYNMNKYNSFAFDGTINDYPYNYTNKISFTKKNINSFNDDKNNNLHFLIQQFNNIFLKMDIEGCEYKWILSLNTMQLNKFKQIVIEFHGITDDTHVHNSVKMVCLEKLSKTHYLIHAHGNNYGRVLYGIPDVIELTYVNKKYFTTIPDLNTSPLPIHNLDMPNNNNIPDFNLNFYPFVSK
jgi:hypothetical protein